MTIPLADDVVVHRVGGASVERLRLGPLDRAAAPPGLSVLAGGTPGEASARMRIMSRARKWQVLAGTVATATAAEVRAAGFDVVEMATVAIPNHARITHPDGADGFTDENLSRLADAFQTTTGH